MPITLRSGTSEPLIRLDPCPVLIRASFRVFNVDASVCRATVSVCNCRRLDPRANFRCRAAVGLRYRHLCPPHRGMHGSGHCPHSSRAATRNTRPFSTVGILPEAGASNPSLAVSATECWLSGLGKTVGRFISSGGASAGRPPRSSYTRHATRAGMLVPTSRGSHQRSL